jgi:hypothetical protein
MCLAGAVLFYSTASGQMKIQQLQSAMKRIFDVLG